MDSKEIRIEYCPNSEMIADYFTKLLEGRQFYKLQDRIMNIDSDSKYHSNHRSALSAGGTDMEDYKNDVATGVKATKVDEVEEVSSGSDVVKTSYRDVVVSGRQ